MSQNGWETTIFTGNPEMDGRTVEQHRQSAAAQGMDLQVQPLQSGGFHVRAIPRGGYGAPPPQGGGGYGGPPQGGYVPQGGYGAAQAAFAGPGMNAGPAPVVVGGRAVLAKADTPEKILYIRKVYGLLAMSAFFAIGAGWAAISVGPTVSLAGAHGRHVVVPALVAALMNPIMMWVAFGILFVAVMGASAVSKVKGLNVAALIAVSVLLGVELAPMVFVAQYKAGLGHTLSAAPVRDAFTLVGAIFVGITTYVYVTRKDFSFLYATLYMGFFVVFGACILGGFFHSEVFSLAIATAGALLAAGFLLYNTSRIFRTSDYSDAVGDALGLIVQLRNLFMFILSILMSSRR
jgi:FtsH-binding integral membrane protein